MKIAQKYSHLNGEEYLIVHHNNLYKMAKDPAISRVTYLSNHFLLPLDKSKL